MIKFFLADFYTSKSVFEQNLSDIDVNFEHSYLYAIK